MTLVSRSVRRHAISAASLVQCNIPRSSSKFVESLIPAKAASGSCVDTRIEALGLLIRDCWKDTHCHSDASGTCSNSLQWMLPYPLTGLHQ